jgi:DNA-binding transcriptional regulator YiaG
MGLRIGGTQLLGLLLAGLQTTTDCSAATQRTFEMPALSTTAGMSVSVVGGAATAIGELRRLTALTWDQLARIFAVSRRTMHFWASGKPLTASNEERLHRVLSVVRRMDRGSASANRTALLAGGPDGETLFSLLTRGRLDDAQQLVVPSSLPARARPAPLSESARAARRPPAPGELVGALQDRSHAATGRLLVAKKIRLPKGE